ncbi:related to phosphoethanolamine [Ramularia collo-cygni]|uniref:ethanolamine-phosphate cytidylyltransferase n=1 Tax=Ramularia collo-cygni TaxID=112498 RepID=A0A2D3VIB6_9PEZI|nr:related to phosphoethanolamine [Ramularia collo-cygni]CZT20553.1 related to phosphoethanolamine [Ramularia collo-cygni]
MATIDPDVGCVVPGPGEWPVDPQEPIPIREDRLWVDGCFDFFHHGHAGVLLQSRRLGASLFCGVHSDADITLNKGPTVMSLAERVAAMEACRFSTKVVPNAPYVTSIPWISHYGCQYVSHGDDITSDAGGEDSYRFVKKAGRMKIVPRTQGISTTDLVGRMLDQTTGHFVQSLEAVIQGKEKSETGDAKEVGRLLKEYAAAENGVDPGIEVFTYDEERTNAFERIVEGTRPRPGQRIVYVDGAFDLFSSGHIAFLQTVSQMESERGHKSGWFEEAKQRERIEKTGSDYPPAFIVAGVHSDAVVNAHRGGNYPIMNVIERGLCVVQCAYIHAVVFGAPFVPVKAYLETLPFGDAGARTPNAVYHGPTNSPGRDEYSDAKAMGIYIETAAHAFQEVNAEQIVGRIMERKEDYIERQRKKGIKSLAEREAEAEEKRKAGNL